MRCGGQSNHSHQRSRNPELWRGFTSCPEKPREPEQDGCLLQDAAGPCVGPLCLNVFLQQAGQGQASLLWTECRTSPLGHESKCQSSWDELDFETEIKDRGGKPQNKNEGHSSLASLCFGLRILGMLKDLKAKAASGNPEGRREDGRGLWSLSEHPQLAAVCLPTHDSKSIGSIVTSAAVSAVDTESRKGAIHCPHPGCCWQDGSNGERDSQGQREVHSPWPWGGFHFLAHNSE